MGKAADDKVTEIEETRRRLEADLRELETRLPAPIRSTKSLLGLMLGGTALSALLLQRLRSKRSDASPTEVVVRIVRDDLGTSD
ncbi:MAG: hypothetical protein MUP92_01540 [Actinobacteria bacterium]|nr:hypothetical protein [Actinomycetota bacterium]